MKKGERSRDNILNVSLDLFSQQGFANTSVQDIANQCGISQTTVFYHYKNKKVLFEAILEKVISNNRNFFNERLNPELSAYDKLITLLISNIDWCLEYPKDAKILLMLFNFSTSDETFKSLTTETINNGRALVLKSLEDLDENNLFHSKMSLSECAIIIQQYINAVLFQVLARDDGEIVASQFKSTVHSLVDSLIGINE